MNAPISIWEIDLLANINTSGFSIYSNPLSNQLTIQTENELSNATASILDLFGRVVMQEKLNPQQTIINTSTLNSGIYFLKINTAGKRVSKSLLKNKTTQKLQKPKSRLQSRHQFKNKQ